MQHSFIKIACLLLAFCLFPLFSMAEIREIDSLQVAKMLQTPMPQRVIIDVRTPEEFAQGHIEGAKMINYLSPDFEEQISKLDKDAPYILHCRTGVRSAKALSIMKQLGFVNIVHMNDGIIGWVNNKLPIVK